MREIDPSQAEHLFCSRLATALGLCPEAGNPGAPHEIARPLDLSASLFPTDPARVWSTPLWRRLLALALLLSVELIAIQEGF
jgi:hypothetical protein